MGIGLWTNGRSKFFLNQQHEGYIMGSVKALTTIDRAGQAFVELLYVSFASHLAPEHFGSGHRERKAYS